MILRVFVFAIIIHALLRIKKNLYILEPSLLVNIFGGYLIENLKLCIPMKTTMGQWYRDLVSIYKHCTSMCLFICQSVALSYCYPVFDWELISDAFYNKGSLQTRLQQLDSMWQFLTSFMGIQM